MTNAFEILCLPIRYDLSEGEIQSRYHAEVAIWHPDRVVSSVEKMVASQRSQALNEAYQRLINPLHRAEEVMAAYGWQAAPPGPEFFSWVLDQDIEAFQKEWHVLCNVFAEAINSNDQASASSIYGRMCYIYPRLQGK